MSSNCCSSSKDIVNKYLTEGESVKDDTNFYVENEIIVKKTINCFSFFDFCFYDNKRTKYSDEYTLSDD
jgi:hypothetical protein